MLARRTLIAALASPTSIALLYGFDGGPGIPSAQGAQP